MTLKYKSLLCFLEFILLPSSKFLNYGNISQQQQYKIHYHTPPIDSTSQTEMNYLKLLFSSSPVNWSLRLNLKLKNTNVESLNLFLFFHIYDLPSAFEFLGSFNEMYLQIELFFYAQSLLYMCLEWVTPLLTDTFLYKRSPSYMSKSHSLGNKWHLQSLIHLSRRNHSPTNRWPSASVNTIPHAFSSEETFTC